jgi:hypothetical protein
MTMFDFGPLAAQHDRQLLSYFHVTQQATSLINFKSAKHSFLFVARPGSGKTSLLRWLDTSGDHYFTLVISPEKTRLSAGDSTLNPSDLLVMVSTELYSALISEVLARSLGSAQSQKEAKNYLSKDWKQTVGHFFQQKFVGVSVLGCGFTLKPDDRRVYLQEIRRTGQLVEARRVLEQLARETKIVLVLDDPELIVGEGLDDVTPENARRLGVLLSVLAEVHAIGIRVIVFLREHVLQNARAHYDNFQQFSDRIEGVEWTETDLIEMLDRRVTKRLKVSWDQVFECSKNTLQEKVFPFLVNGPRDLLTLCNLAGKEMGRISMTRLEKGLRAFTVDKWRDLSTFYGRQWPQIDKFARAMVKALKAKYQNKPIPPGAIRAEFESQFGKPGSDIHALRKRTTWINNAKWETPPVDEKLFVIGCLGYTLGKEKFYPWAGRDTDRFRLADSHFISPAFSD